MVEDRLQKRYDTVRSDIEAIVNNYLALVRLREQFLIDR
jgi:hypothetical protein